MAKFIKIEQESATEVQNDENSFTAMKCNSCRKCLDGVIDEESGWPVLATRFIVCSKCGNKRCPKATNHNLECTNSNEPGQYLHDIDEISLILPGRVRYLGREEG